MIASQAGDVPITMVKAWMERLPEFIKGNLPEDTLNMDELALFFKTAPQKDLAEKGKKSQGGKNDALLHCLWLLMALMTPLWYGDLKNLIALKTKQTFLACMESIILQMLKLG